jgi:methyl-accepting chemotaxis protein
MAEGNMNVNTVLDISCVNKDLIDAYTEMDNDLLLVKESISALARDASMLSEAAVAGKLATRADPAKHKGMFRDVVLGVNQTLDAVVGPLNVAAKYVDEISKGAIPA